MIKKEEHYFDSKDNMTKIHYICWCPDSKPILILQIVHGMIDFIDRYDDFANYLADNGIMVIGHDHLGHGSSIKSENDFGFFADKNGVDILLKDMHTLSSIYKKKYPNVPIVMLGHSMGSLLTRLYLTKYGHEVNSAIILGTTYQSKSITSLAKIAVNILSLFMGKRYRSTLVNNMAFGRNNKSFEPARTPFDWLTRDEVIVDKYIAEPRNNFIFTLSAYKDLFTLLGRLSDDRILSLMPKYLPVLFIAGERDPVGGFGKSVNIIYKKFLLAGMSKVDIKLYGDDRHEILNELDRSEIYEYLYNWIVKSIKNSRL